MLVRILFGSFEFWCFEFVSNFVLRISDLRQPILTTNLISITKYLKAAVLVYCRICPSPCTTNLVVVSSSSPMGPKACSFEVLMPISAPNPSCPPSLKRVEAFTRTTDESTSRTKRWPRCAGRNRLPYARWPRPYLRLL